MDSELTRLDWLYIPRNTDSDKSNVHIEHAWDAHSVTSEELTAMWLIYSSLQHSPFRLCTLDQIHRHVERHYLHYETTQYFKHEVGRALTNKFFYKVRDVGEETLYGMYQEHIPRFLLTLYEYDNKHRLDERLTGMPSQDGQMPVPSTYRAETSVPKRPAYRAERPAHGASTCHGSPNVDAELDAAKTMTMLHTTPVKRPTLLDLADVARQEIEGCTF